MKSKLVNVRLSQEKTQLLEFAVVVMGFSDRSELIRHALDETLDWNKLRQAKAAAEDVFCTKTPEEKPQPRVEGKVIG